MTMLTLHLQAYPEAQIIGPDTLPEYRDKQSYFKVPSDKWLLTRPNQALTVSEEFDREFDFEYVHSHMNKELVFNHKPSRTLIEADLIFNLPATEQMSRTGESATSGLLTKLFTGINHTQGSAVWQKRFIWYGPSSADRPAFNKSVARIAAWDFDRIIPCHGDVIETGGKGVFEKIMEWHLKATT